MKRILVLAALLLATTPARAEDPSGLKTLPRWHMSNGEACYAFEDARKLVLLDQELTYLKTEALPTYAAMYKDMRASGDRLNGSLKAVTVALDASNESRDRLYKELEQAIKDKNAAQQDAATAGQVGWIVAGGVTLVTLGLAGGLYLSK